MTGLSKSASVRRDSSLYRSIAGEKAAKVVAAIRTLRAGWRVATVIRFVSAANILVPSSRWLCSNVRVVADARNVTAAVRALRSGSRVRTVAANTDAPYAVAVVSALPVASGWATLAVYANSLYVVVTVRTWRGKGGWHRNTVFVHLGKLRGRVV